MMERNISDIAPLKRNSSKKSDNDTIGKMIGAGSNQMPLTRKNSKLANALNLAVSNNMMLSGGGGFMGMGGMDMPFGAPNFEDTYPIFGNNQPTLSA
jgi:hypothetical protein